MIIILNGCASAGKSSIAKELQKLHEKPLLHLGIDRFWAMIPDEYKEFGSKAHEGYSFTQTVDADNNPIVNIKTGPFAERMDETMPQVIKCCAEFGHDVVVDEILQRNEIVHHYAKALQDHVVYFIGIRCDLEELERREKMRGNRTRGLARGQINIIHTYSDYYDLTIDSTHDNAITCAQKIMDFIRMNPDPVGIKKLLTSKNLYYCDICLQIPFCAK